MTISKRKTDAEIMNMISAIKSSILHSSKERYIELRNAQITALSWVLDMGPMREYKEYRDKK